MKEIIVLGASGSIGTQALDVIKNNPEMFVLKAFTVGFNTTHVDEYIKIFNPEALCFGSEDTAELYRTKYPHLSIYAGDQGLVDIVSNHHADIVLNSVMGFVGLKPTMAAIEHKMDIALANKETLVAGGNLVMDAVKEHDVKLLPVDSEHSAIFQCLLGNDKKDLDTITITASGGSFRDLSRDQLSDVSKEDALNHPNWSMGEKITIDSATMMNKGLEVIEAHYLFGIDYDDIKVIEHHESIVHSFVTFKDSSTLAQLGEADMRVPIQFAFTYPHHLELINKKKMDLRTIGSLSFKTLSFERFPLIKLAYEMGKQGDNMPVVMNSANEVAVSLFLNDKISFLDIETIIINTCRNYRHQSVSTIDDVIAIDKEVRSYVYDHYLKIKEGE